MQEKFVPVLVPPDTIERFDIMINAQNLTNETSSNSKVGIHELWAHEHFH